MNTKKERQKYIENLETKGITLNKENIARFIKGDINNPQTKSTLDELHPDNPSYY